MVEGHRVQYEADFYRSDLFLLISQITLSSPCLILKKVINSNLLSTGPVPARSICGKLVCKVMAYWEMSIYIEFSNSLSEPVLIFKEQSGSTEHTALC